MREMKWRHIIGAEQWWQSYLMTWLKEEVTTLLMVSPLLQQRKEQGKAGNVYVNSTFQQQGNWKCLK